MDGRTLRGAEEEEEEEEEASPAGGRDEEEGHACVRDVPKTRFTNVAAIYIHELDLGHN